MKQEMSLFLIVKQCIVELPTPPIACDLVEIFDGTISIFMSCHVSFIAIYRPFISLAPISYPSPCSCATGI